MGPCCHNSKRRSTWSRVTAMLSWMVPSAILAVVPKCPACIVAYVAVLTGMGVSFSMAWYIRTGLILVCVIVLVYFVVRRLEAIAKWTGIWRTS